jgi:toxin ParE1/3/4
VKAYTVFFTPRAEGQLEDLYAYIAQHSSVARAESLVGAVVADCLSPLDLSRAGNQARDIRPNLRTKGYARRVTIAFSVNVSTGVVAIHGILYGGQDFEMLLRETDSDD